MNGKFFWKKRRRKVETADFYLKEITPSDYKAQIDFKKLKFLVRSKNLAQIEIKKIVWEKIEFGDNKNY